MTPSRTAQRVSLGMLVAIAGALSQPATAAGQADSSGGTSATAARKAERDCALEVAGRVQAYYDQIADFEADFEQVTKSVALGGGGAGNEAARGKVIMAKPGKMRWHYTEPAESVVASDGVNLWIYNVAAKEVQHLVASSEFLSGAALQFLMGRGVIAEDFVVASSQCSSELPVVELDLTPRVAASYERLGLRVVRSSGEVTRTTLIDLFGNVTTISFRNARINRAPPAATFDFETPPGVELIELTAPP